MIKILVQNIQRQRHEVVSNIVLTLKANQFFLLNIKLFSHQIYPYARIVNTNFVQRWSEIHVRWSIKIKLLYRKQCLIKCWATPFSAPGEGYLLLGNKHKMVSLFWILKNHFLLKLLVAIIYEIVNNSILSYLNS